MNKKVLAFIYNEKKRKFLILKTGDSNEELHGPSEWYTVTGSVEKGESHENAVKREVKEETNLEVKEVYPLQWGCIYEWQGEEHEELYFIAFADSEGSNPVIKSLNNVLEVLKKEFSSMPETPKQMDESREKLKAKWNE